MADELHTALHASDRPGGMRQLIGDARAAKILLHSMQVIDWTLENAVRMREAADIPPVQGEQRQRILDFEAKVARVESVQKELAPMFQGLNRAVEQSDEETAALLATQIHTKMQEAGTLADEIVGGLDTITKEDFRAVNVVSESLDNTYENVQILSYILYALGWSVALIARVCGAEGGFVI